MPAGDPAGYLPNVKRARRRKGQPVYQPRKLRKRLGPVGDSQTGGTMAPPNLSVDVPKPKFPIVKKPRRSGYQPDMPEKIAPPGMRRRPFPHKGSARGGRRRYFGRAR